MTAPVAQHPGDGLAHPVDDAEHVDRELAGGGGIVLVDERADHHDPGIVHQDVERAEARFDVVEEPGERRRVGDVEAEPDGGPAQRRCSCARQVGVEVADRHPGSVGRQPFRSGPADPPGGASDRDHPVAHRSLDPRHQRG